jgi:hypothetical protein
MDITLESVQLRNVIAFKVRFYGRRKYDFTELGARLGDSLIASLIVILSCDSRVKGQNQIAGWITDSLRALFAVEFVEYACIGVLPCLC